MSTFINNINMENSDYDAFVGAYNDRMERLQTTKTGDEIKIETLTKENEKLREDYAGLVKKANILVETYRKLKTENETLEAEKEVLIKKKVQRDSITKVFNKVGKSGRSTWDKIILWFKT